LTVDDANALLRTLAEFQDKEDEDLPTGLYLEDADNSAILGGHNKQ
jgi:hypothetical protein